MGQLCGREDHFPSGPGNTLGSSSTKQGGAAPPAPASVQGGYSVASKGKSTSTSPPQRLGGTAGGEADAHRREAMLKAAEAREKAAATRGTSNGGGKLATQLAAQTKDGGRAAEARLEAERRGEQLVWD